MFPDEGSETHPGEMKTARSIFCCGLIFFSDEESCVRICPGESLSFSAFPDSSEIVISQLDQAAADPADRIAESDQAGRICHKAGDEEQINLADDHKGKDHDEHGPGRVAASAQGARQNMIDTVGKQKEHICPDKEHAELNDGRILCKETDRSGGKEKEGGGNPSCNQQSQEN